MKNASSPLRNSTIARYPTDRPSPFQAMRCFMPPPPRSASIWPLPMRRTAPQSAASSIPSRSAKRANGLVLNVRHPFLASSKRQTQFHSTKCDSILMDRILAIPGAARRLEALSGTTSSTGSLHPPRIVAPTGAAACLAANHPRRCARRGPATRGAAGARDPASDWRPGVGRAPIDNHRDILLNGVIARTGARSEQ